MDRRTSWPVLLIVLAAFALRIYRLDYQELRGDEAFSVMFSTRSARNIVSETIRTVEPHPPLDYLLLRGWTAVAGDSEFAVRFLSVVAGTMAVALAYALARRMFGLGAGLGGAALLAINAFQVWHAQEARMYTISAALALAATLALWIALERGDRRAMLAYALLTAIHLYLHYYALFVVLAQGVWAVALWRRYRQRLLGLLAAGAAVVLLYLPWLLLAWRVILAYHGNGDSPSLPDMLVRTLRAFSVGETMQASGVVAFLIAFGVLGAVGVWWAGRSGPRGALLLGLWLLVPLGGVWLASLRRPVFNERYVLAASPPFYLFLGAGAGWLSRRGRWGRSALALLGATCLLGSAWSLHNYYAVPQYSKSAGWRDLVAYLDAHAEPGDTLVQNYPDPALAYYYRGSIPWRVLPERQGARPETIAGALDNLQSQCSRLWFLPYPDPAWDEAGVVGQWLARHSDRTEELRIGNIRLEAYMPLRESLRQMVPVDAVLGSAIGLRGYQLKGEAQPGEKLQLTLYWESVAPVDVDYTVFAHLVAEDDAMLGQDDHAPQHGAAPTSSWQVGELLADHYEILIPAGTPPRAAQLLVGMYEPATGVRLPATGPVDGANRIHLTDLQIRAAP